MPNHNEEGRNLWGSARERDRRRARREISSRVATAVVRVGNGDGASKSAVNDSSGRHDIYNTNGASDSMNVLSDQDTCTTIVRQMLRHIESGKASAFSVTTLSKHFEILNKPVPTSLLSPFKIKTLCTSRFGIDYAQTLQEYIDARESCTLFEYASFLGEYKLLGPMIAGGLDPTMRGRFKKENGNGGTLRRHLALSVRVVRRFLDAFPSSLSSYIVKRVIDMRLDYWKEYSQDVSPCTVCGSSDDHAQLSFGLPCRHTFCEDCFWQHLLEGIDDRHDGDVIVCPVCGESNSSDDYSHDTSIYSCGDSPTERCQQSLEKFKALPANIKELKQRPKSLKRRQRHLTASWNEAVLQCVGSSRDVRNDKFFNYTERNAFHYVRGCLLAGVDVNATNDYGQTCLHIAAWRGYTKLVELLLFFGADPSIESNGGVSAKSASESNGHTDVVDLLRKHPGSSVSSGRVRFQEATRETNRIAGPKVETLIGLEVDHPGAGSYLIDGGLSEECIDAMIDLWRGLPVVHCDGKKKKGPNTLCSVRSYYCDSEGHLCNLLTDVICKAFSTDIPLAKVAVFPNMRFLHYAHAGSVLTPHTDLPRTDLFSGNSSTHTLILYLFDCRNGGETSLLWSESGEGRNETLAKVSPRRGRLFLFPHACPHQGNEVVDVPKVLIRGEVMLTR